MNNPHRISLKSQWKVEAHPSDDEPNRMSLRSVRIFHSPSGLQANQVVCLRFACLSDDMQFRLNGQQQPLTVAHGFAVASVNHMLKPVNQIELIWRADSAVASWMPEDFGAWLEITDVIEDEYKLKSFVDT